MHARLDGGFYRVRNCRYRAAGSEGNGHDGPDEFFPVFLFPPVVGVDDVVDPRHDFGAVPPSIGNEGLDAEGIRINSPLRGWCLRPSTSCMEVS